MRSGAFLATFLVCACQSTNSVDLTRQQFMDAWTQRADRYAREYNQKNQAIKDSLAIAFGVQVANIRDS